MCLPAQVEQPLLLAVICVAFVQLMYPNTLVFAVIYLFIFVSGTAFKTQKEVVKAIFVNNIERLGHHYARVFDESW